MQVPLEVGLSVGSAVASVAVAAYARHRDAPGSFGVFVFCAATAFWAGGNAVQLVATHLDVALLAADIEWVGIALVPVGWFTFAAAFSGRESWVNRRTLAALAIFPVVTLALVATNDYHHLVRTSASLVGHGESLRLDRTFGPWPAVTLAYSNVVNATGTVLLLTGALRVGGHYREQATVVLAGATVPWAATVAYYLGAVTIDPASLFGVTALAFGYAIHRYDLIDLVPVARDRVLAELDDGIIVVADDERVADANPAADRLLGRAVSPGDVVADTFPPALLARLRGDVEPTDSDPISLVDADGEPRWVSVEVAPVSAERPGRVVLLRDVTELERRRRALRRENERLERVADTISHDLRNPLNVASGYLEIARESGDEAAFERVEDGLERIDDIVEGTLRLARSDVDDPDLRGVELASVAERAWQNVPTEDATLRLDCGGLVVRADPGHLERVLENLFRNAVEHAGEDTTVTVGRTAEGFFVADDGPGLPDEVRSQAFERGFTTSEDGTGFGLAIVRDVADAHGWTAAFVDAAEGARLEVSAVATGVPGEAGYADGDGVEGSPE